MAKPGALRTFQSRLAERLRAARTTGSSASWLAVEAAGERYLLPLAHAGEIFPWSAPQSVPYTVSWFLGVASLRGGLYGVIDLVGLIGACKEPPAPEDGLAHAPSQLVTLNKRLEVNAALLVDRLIGLRAPEAFTASSTPPAGAPVWFGRRYADAAGADWQEIDLQSLAQHPRFLNIGARFDERGTEQINDAYLLKDRP